MESETRPRGRTPSAAAAAAVVAARVALAPPPSPPPAPPPPAPPPPSLPLAARTTAGVHLVVRRALGRLARKSAPLPIAGGAPRGSLDPPAPLRPRCRRRPCLRRRRRRACPTHVTCDTNGYPCCGATSACLYNVATFFDVDQGPLECQTCIANEGDPCTLHDTTPDCCGTMHCSGYDAAAGVRAAVLPGRRKLLQLGLPLLRQRVPLCRFSRNVRSQLLGPTTRPAAPFRGLATPAATTATAARPTARRKA